MNQIRSKLNPVRSDDSSTIDVMLAEQVSQLVWQHLRNQIIWAVNINSKVCDYFHRINY